jgi:hypothetical protein
MLSTVRRSPFASARHVEGPHFSFLQIAFENNYYVVPGCLTEQNKNIISPQRQVVGSAMSNWKSRILGVLGAFIFSPIGPNPGQAGSALSPVQQDREMVSWVVLANSYVDLTLDSLRAKLDEIYPGQFLPPREKGNFVIDGPTPGGFLIQANLPGAAGMFLLHNVPGPYRKFSDFAKAIADPAIRKKAMAQCCWLSVDRIGKHGSEEDGYRFIGQVLAKLAPSDAAFLVHPSKLVTIVFDDELRGRLARGERILPNL